MQTITIKADESLITQTIAVSKALAKTSSKELIIQNSYTDELNKRADDALNGLNLINQDKAKLKFEAIRNGTYASQI